MMESLVEHFHAYRKQKAKGDPMIVALDERDNILAQQPAYDRHEKLKQPEMKTHAEGLPEVIAT